MPSVQDGGPNQTKLPTAGGLAEAIPFNPGRAPAPNGALDLQGAFALVNSIWIQICKGRDLGRDWLWTLERSLHVHVLPGIFES